MADIQTIVSGDTVSAALLTRCVNNFAVTQNLYASATAPASPVAFQLWLDTSTTPDSLKQRNAANSAWVVWFPDVTSAGGGLLPLTGGTMSGAIAMGTSKITGVGNATAAQDVTSKAQVDAMVQGQTRWLGASLTASDNFYLMVAGPGTMTINDCIIVSESGVASHATDLWTFNVRNLTAGVNLRSSAKSTNGAAITADTAYALGLDQNLTPSSGAVLQLQVVKGGSAAALTEAVAIIRYSVAV